MTDNLNPSLGPSIRASRVDAGLSLRELARRIDVAPSYMNDIEHDRRTPSEAVLIKIAEQLPLDFDDLLALAGRLGEDTELYLKSNPTVGVLLRTVSGANLNEENLQRLLKSANRMAKTQVGDEPKA
ncbi:hypothetical protein B7R21_18075 [Subtercola boreus]|uniref:HTH cro/C1-type domain-containing protein n=1 Tax=Subtercola boreus TaxID=120213 RepID=A0A3E0VAI9_9MICO|nr:helix-turn-helix transcriptional regulator [Subtercola boreus]RFA06866.1 hypothetical protein B7R21_18075 [Subtercola boreus]